VESPPLGDGDMGGDRGREPVRGLWPGLHDRGLCEAAPMTPPTPSEVKRVDQSPVNPRRWCLELSCGHEVWITASRRPIRTTHPCMCEGKGGYWK
jgi:hypothetical protein